MHEVPGSHIHYEGHNSLEEGSSELIIVKTGGHRDVQSAVSMDAKQVSNTAEVKNWVESL